MDFYPNFIPLQTFLAGMEDHIAEKLREAGYELTENHDEETIRAVIADLEDLESPESDLSAGIIRIMTQNHL